MNNPLAKVAGGMDAQPNPFKVFMQNPMQFLLQRNINIPQEYSTDPKAAVQYLLDNGKMSQQQFNQLQQYATKNFGVKLE